jgi:hypothetical protein
VEWLVGLLCLALCVSIVVWSFLARHRETLESLGVLVRNGGVFIGTNAPKADWIDVPAGPFTKARRLTAAHAVRLL